jgi:hypothetical protein
MTEQIPVPVDPWIDDDFAPLDTRKDKSDLMHALVDLADEEPEFAPTAEEVVAADGPKIVVPPAPEILVTDKPEVIDYPDGSRVTIEKTPKGLKATLDPGNGKSLEVFYGKTESELLRQLLPAKLNATKIINKQNKELKTVRIADESRAVPAPPVSKALTADEVFEIKTQLASNPDLAMETWFQKKTGLSLAQLSSFVQNGQNAANKLNAETEAKEFLLDNPTYYKTDNNFYELVGYIARVKGDKDAKALLVDEKLEALMEHLSKIGVFTKENLSEAFDELSEAGELETAPRRQRREVPAPTEEIVEPPAIPAAPATVQEVPATDERIVRTVRRSRAAFGLRGTDTTVPAIEPSSKAPSDEELDSLSDAEISDLMNQTKRLRAQSARR